jgi:hypothetical protein
LRTKYSAAARSGAVSDEHELGAHFVTHHGEHFHHVGDALHGPEIRQVHQDRLPVRGPFRAQDWIRFAAIKFAVHKIGDHFDGALDVEFLDRALLQIMRDRGDAVGLFDRKFGDWQETPVVSDQGNVGAVQRGDEGQWVRRRHHAREQGVDGMGNRVMDMQQIEAFRLGHLHHFYGQGKRVGRVIEQWITRNLHFMKLNSFVGVRQSDWRRVADEVDFVAAARLHPRNFHAKHFSESFHFQSVRSASAILLSIA